jgi:hypothetical protein
MRSGRATDRRTPAAPVARVCVLDGTDYFVKNAEDGIEVIVLRASGTSGAPAAAVFNNAVAANQAAPSQLPPLASYLTGK